MNYEIKTRFDSYFDLHDSFYEPGTSAWVFHEERKKEASHSIFVFQ